MPLPLKNTKITLYIFVSVYVNVSNFSFGAKDAKARHASKEKQYDLLLDDEIEFIQVKTRLRMPVNKMSKFMFCVDFMMQI
jgi:hypothetical protein